MTSVRASALVMFLVFPALTGEAGAASARTRLVPLVVTRTNLGTSPPSAESRRIESGLRSLIEELPTDSLVDDAKLELARLMRQTGRTAEAVAMYEELARNSPADTLAEFTMAFRSYDTPGDKGIVAKEEHLEVYPNRTDDVALWELAQLRKSQGRKKECLGYLEELVTRRTHGYCEREDFEAKVEVWRPHREAVFRLGAGAQAEGNTSTAIKWFRLALRIYAEAPTFDEYLDPYIPVAEVVFRNAHDLAALSDVCRKRRTAVLRELAQIPPFGLGVSSVSVTKHHRKQRQGTVYFYTREKKAQLEEKARSLEEEINRLEDRMKLGRQVDSSAEQSTPKPPSQTSSIKRLPIGPPPASGAEVSRESNGSRATNVHSAATWLNVLIVCVAGVSITAAVAWILIRRQFGRQFRERPR